MEYLIDFSKMENLIDLTKMNKENIHIVIGIEYPTDLTKIGKFY